MRLDDLVVLNPNIDGDYYPVTRADVLQAALTEPCRRCEGEGGWDKVDAWDDRIREWVTCSVCGGRGWVLIEDPNLRMETLTYGDHSERVIVVPLSMLEGNDT